MYSDSPLIQHLVALLKAHDVRQIVVSPGSRHYPIVRSLEADPDFRLFSVVDERSAAFFALGLIQQSGRPAAAICTSGTAALNYISAVAEAYYQNLPLLIMTGDRPPELLNQLEEQMLKQDDAFRNFVRFHGQLKQVVDDTDLWFCNRVINEALLALTHRGRGPVHLNIPIRSDVTLSEAFNTPRLPDVRTIRRVGLGEPAETWAALGRALAGKRVAVVWGQSGMPPGALVDSLGAFVAAYDCVVLGDHLSNLAHEARVRNVVALLRAASTRDVEAIAPDVIVSVFGNMVFNTDIKGFLRREGVRPFEHWRVSEDGAVVDPFRRLTNVFEMGPQEFFANMAAHAPGRPAGEYRRAVLEISAQVPEPDLSAAFTELEAIGGLLKALPKGAALHIANSASVRMAQLFAIDESVEVLCNRGVDGIDGCMSSTVGYAAVAERPTFLVIGDLAFFYDMNALWSRYLSPGLRILLVNNGGGALMHSSRPPERGDALGHHVSAGHGASGRGWAESQGIGYAGARTPQEYRAGLEKLVAPDADGPVLLEVFTEKQSDIAALTRYYHGLSRITVQERARRKVRMKAKAVRDRLR